MQGHHWARQQAHDQLPFGALTVRLPPLDIRSEMLVGEERAIRVLIYGISNMVYYCGLPNSLCPFPTGHPLRGAGGRGARLQAALHLQGRQPTLQQHGGSGWGVGGREQIVWVCWLCVTPRSGMTDIQADNPHVSNTVGLKDKGCRGPGGRREGQLAACSGRMQGGQPALEQHGGEACGVAVQGANCGGWAAVC